MDYKLFIELEENDSSLLNKLESIFDDLFYNIILLRYSLELLLIDR